MRYLISSKISGLSRSRCFILSFIAVMMELALSSAPCFDDFSAAPAKHTAQAMPTSSWQLRDAPGVGPRPAPKPTADNSQPRPDKNPTSLLNLQILFGTLCQIWSVRWPRAAQAGVDLSTAPLNQIHTFRRILLLNSSSLGGLLISDSSTDRQIFGASGMYSY